MACLSCGLSATTTLILLCCIFFARGAAPIGPNDARFDYEGRWTLFSNDSNTNLVTADWPCSAVHFTVNFSVTGTFTLIWSALRARANVTVVDADSGALVTPAQILIGSDVDVDPFTPPRRTDVEVPRAGAFHVTLRKLTTASPYGTGVGSDVFRASTFSFGGVELPDEGSPSLSSLRRNTAPARRIALIGASDTAGYCVDGDPSMSPLDFGPRGWRYENCGRGSGARLARRFGAGVSVQAISGIGLTQNAAAKEQWQMGALAMPDYWNRTLQSRASPVWGFARGIPDLLLISLGGNDYNHQNGNVPTNATFTKAYAAFLSRVFRTYAETNPWLVVASVCGQGSPVEAKQDPDNNRCKPCPHVEAATNAFRVANPTLSNRTAYFFVPCDGSVVTGDGDIGCAGHKNAAGQAKVAAFLEPKIAQLMGWN